MVTKVFFFILGDAYERKCFFCFAVLLNANEKPVVIVAEVLQ